MTDDQEQEQVDRLARELEDEAKADAAARARLNKVSGNGKQRSGPKAKRTAKKRKLTKEERATLIAKVNALRSKTVAAGCTAAEAQAAAQKAKELMDEYKITVLELEFGLTDVAEDDFRSEDALRESAKGLIASKNVLAHFEAAWRKMMAGEMKSAKLLYLICTSRLFDRPMSAVLKGPSAAGKSEIRKRVLQFFFPPEVRLEFHNAE